MLAVFATGGGGAGESTSIEKKLDNEKELDFYSPFCLLGSHPQVFLLQDLSSSKKNALLLVINNLKHEVILPSEGRPLQKEVRILFHLVKIRELTNTSTHQSIKVQAKKILKCYQSYSDLTFSRISLYLK